MDKIIDELNVIGNNDNVYMIVESESDWGKVMSSGKESLEEGGWGDVGY